MPIISADKVLNQTLYAKGIVDGLSGDFSTVTARWTNGEAIGNVYSYIERPDGLYWMIYTNDANYQNFIPTYIKHDESKLSLPALPDILAQITKEKDAADLAAKGPLQYNIDKYAPYVIGAVVVAVGLPALIGIMDRKKVSGMKKNNTLLIAGAAVAAYFLLKKKKTKAGVPIIEDLGGGIVQDQPQTPTNNGLPKDNIFENAYSVAQGAPVGITASIATGGGNNAGSTARIQSVGPFVVSYENSNNALAGRKGDLGRIKSN